MYNQSRSSSSSRSSAKSSKASFRAASSRTPHRSAQRSASPKFKMRMTNRYVMPKDADINYKNFPLLSKYITERGKIVSRRISGVTASEQRQLAKAIQRARFLALLSSGSVK